MNNILRSIRRALGVAVLLLVTVVPMSAPPSANARPDVGLGVVSANSRLAYQATSEAPTNQIIIKYKATADISGVKAPAHPDRISTLSAVAGVQLEYFREMSGDAHVLRLPNRLPISEVSLITEKLMTLSDVEYAEPDRILQHTLTPDDPLYTNQWHYYDPWGINAPGAWDITTGSSNVVVAVIDTGITNHTDLSGRTLPGYDFISNVFTANDGNGRDSDPSDPGDWYNVGECSDDPYGSSSSSWHGTHVAGTIGAATNNGIGVAGINWVSKIVPVRVLGKCGGSLSDIVDGMRWAAGLSVSGVPANSNPARVLNMSLGGSGPCSTSEQTAINEIVAAGSVVVVAAGNDHVDAGGFSPASCNGVIAVAATNRSGNRASYSNYGSVVEISAPGGDSGNGVLSTVNTGTTVPASDTYAYYSGTSMATPHVVGVASLVLSVKPSLTPAQVLQVLQDTARDFPTGGTCTTSNCGAGIVDAAAAVSAVSKPDVSIVKRVIGSNFAPGDRITFTLSIANSGGNVATSVVVTDSVPAQVLSPTYASTLTITPTGVSTYVWDVGSLGVGQGGVITIYGQIDPGLSDPVEFANSASVSAAQDNTLGNNTSSVTIGERKVYLPIIGRDPPPIANPGFESGHTGWTEYSGHGWFVIINSGFPGGITPHSGSWAGWLGGAYDDVSYIQQQVFVPVGSAYLAYWHWIASADDCGYDFGGVLVNGSVVDVYNLCQTQNTGGWAKHVVNLGAYAGQSISLRIRVETDNTFNSNLFVDDVAFQSSSSFMQDALPDPDPRNAVPKSGDTRISHGLHGLANIPAQSWPETNSKSR